MQCNPRMNLQLYWPKPTAAYKLRPRRPINLRVSGILQFAAAACLLLTQAAFAGEIFGKVLITRKLTRKTFAPVGYNLRGVAAPAGPQLPDSTNEFSRVIVLLERDDLAPKPPVTGVIQQTNRRFEPELLVVPVGSTVVFPNSDPIFHNVFSFSKAKEFDLGYYPKNQSRSVKFARSGIVQIYCHIHPNMYAAVVVTASRWHAKPKEDGSFSWTGVPPGKYRLVAWHKAAGLFQKEIVVAGTGETTVSIQVPVQETEGAR